MTVLHLRERGLLTHATSLLLCGLLAGLAVAAATFPAIALTGLAAKAGTDTFDGLPSNFTILPSPQITNVYASDGKTMLASVYDENRRDISIDEVPDVMQHAMLAAEDWKFYTHHGVDVQGILRALVNNRNGGDQQGGSTLTMQYVRQLALYSAKTPEDVVGATEKTEARKVREMKYSVALEKRMSKRQILEGYLNIASFGENAWGVWAASLVYFNKSPKDLTLPEAALLASLPKAPSVYDPVTDEGKQAALERSHNYVLPSMVRLKYITQAQADEAAKVTPQIVGSRPPQGCTEVQRPELGAGFFCDYLLRWWADQPDFGENQFERENILRSGGYKIISSLDMNLQRQAYQLAQQRPGAPETTTSSPLAVMMAAVEPGTGRVQALATNRVFSNDQSGNGTNTNPEKRRLGARGNYPNTTLPLITGAGADVPGYQSGSVFKIFTTVAALEAGLPLSYTINAKTVAQTNYTLNYGDPAACPGTNKYCAKNAAASMAGTKNMWTAFGESVNTYFVPLQERVGSAKAVDVAKRLGIQFRSPGDAQYANNPDRANGWGPFTLGVSNSTPLDMANAWATLAADGTYCQATPVLQILDRNGTPVKAGEPHCSPTPVVKPEIARGAIDAARCPVGDRSPTTKCSSGTAGGMRGLIGHPLAGKTGTTDDDNIATLTLATKQLAISGYLVDPDWPMHPGVGNHNIVNQSVGNLMKGAMAGKPQIDFTPPPASVVNGTQVSIPNVKCMDLSMARRNITAAGFGVEVDDTQIESECPAGAVADSDPSGSAPKGITIRLRLSNGHPSASSAPPPTPPSNPRPPMPPGRFRSN